MSLPHYIIPVNLSDFTQLDTKLEHRKVYSLKNLELNIYETFVSSHQVRLSYQGLVITSMMRGRKIIYEEDTEPGYNFLPGTSIIVPEGVELIADFPDADERNPVQCATLAMDWDTVYKSMDYINENYPKADGSEWKLDFSHYHFKNNRSLVQTLNRLIGLSMEECDGKDALADLLLKSLLIRIMQTQEIPLKSGVLDKPENLQLLEKYIYDNISQDFQIEDLCTAVNLSRSSLYRTIRNYYDLSPSDYIQKLRIQYAKAILVQPGKNVSDACFESGFNSLSYFSKIFKKNTDRTPSQYAQEAQEQF